MRALLILVLISSLFTLSASAQSFDPQQIMLLRDTAHDVCQTVETVEGSATTFEVEGNVSAEVNGLIRRLAEVGIGGLGSINSEEFAGMTREAASQAILNGLACREQVFITMFNALVASTPNQSTALNCPEFDLSGAWRMTNIPATADATALEEVGRQNVFDVELRQNCDVVTGQAIKVMYGAQVLELRDQSLLELESIQFDERHLLLSFSETRATGEPVGRGTISLRHSGDRGPMAGEFQAFFAGISGTSVMLPQ